ncbi:MAG: IS1182 family transposase, partial [bacterium]|nr:IS1182 family transposase [bacterium]
MDSFSCPGEHRLKLRRQKKDGTKIYQCENSLCDSCAYKSRCCSSKRGEGRTVRSDLYEPLREEMRNKMGQEEAKNIYKKRKVIVEP